MSLLARCRRGSIVAALACSALGAAAAPAAHANGGQLMVEVGRLSDGSSTAVNPSTIISGLSYNEGAGGRFGVSAPSKFNSNTFTFTPPADTTIAASQVWPQVSAYGWPAMGTWTEITSTWGSWNVSGNPGSATIDGLWSQGGGGLTSGAAGSLTATANQASFGSGAEQTGFFYTDKLNIALADANPPTVVSAPAAGELFGAPNASGWYTAATLPVTLSASDQGSGVRWLLIKDGATVHKYALPGTGASCATKDPNASLTGGDTYTVKVPCPTASASYTVNVDMTTIGDGSHDLQIGAMDASGRSAYDAAYNAVQVNAPGMNPSPDGGTGLSDPGATGPGGCVYQDEGTCPLPPINTTAPSIAGTPKRGQASTVDVGDWTNIADATWGYLWQRCTSTDTSTCVNIVAANSATYTPVLADVDKRLRVLVTPTTSGGAVTASSNVTPTVADGAAAGSTPESGGGNAVSGGGGFGGGGGSAVKKPDNDTVTPIAPTVGADVGSAVRDRGSVNGACDCLEAMLDNAVLKAVFNPTKTDALSVSYGKGTTVSGRLTTKAGDPVRNAALKVTAQLAGGGNYDDRSARTDGDGNFTMRLPRNVLSQTVKIAYVSHTNDTDVAASKTLTLNVKATAALTVTASSSKRAKKTAVRAHTVARNGSWLTFRAQVNGPIPVGGKTVQLQSQCRAKGCAKGWANFGPSGQRTDSKGRFVWRIRTNGTVGTVTYQFRLVIPEVDGASNDWPFSTGFSPTRSLTIKGGHSR